MPVKNLAAIVNYFDRQEAVTTRKPSPQALSYSNASRYEQRGIGEFPSPHPSNKNM